jgi:hypothetical protein
LEIAAENKLFQETLNVKALNADQWRLRPVEKCIGKKHIFSLKIQVGCNFIAKSF